MLQKSHKKYDIDVDPSKNYITDVKEDSRGNHVRVISYIFYREQSSKVLKEPLLLLLFLLAGNHSETNKNVRNGTKNVLGTELWY